MDIAAETKNGSVTVSSSSARKADVRKIRMLWIGLGVYLLIIVNALGYAHRVPYQILVGGGLVNMAIVLSNLCRHYSRLQETEEVRSQADMIPTGAIDGCNLHSAYLLVILGPDYPFVAYFICLAFVLYQLISGNLLNLTWGVWVTRKENPGRYWKVLAVEAAFILIGLYLGTL